MVHLDLFSGIGGFALAVDRVWPGSTHIFCDNDLFCQEVLRKHWPNSKIYGDIRTIRSYPDTDSDGCPDGSEEVNPTETDKQTLSNFEECDRTTTADTTDSGYKYVTNKARISSEEIQERKTDATGECCSIRIDLLTGGFPCQPFSQAGRRRGTADNRYLWPEMLRVIRLTKPTWVVGENVGGFITWNNGMVLEQVCLDLEGEGYEVQPFIIPAVSVNAPHRRDRVWIVAHSESIRVGGRTSQKRPIQKWKLEQSKQKRGQVWGESERCDSDVTNATRGQREQCTSVREEETRFGIESKRDEWEQDWLTVATRLCRVDDGVRNRVDRLKALGNAIVPQVAEEIFKAIKQI